MKSTISIWSIIGLFILVGCGQNTKRKKIKCTETTKDSVKITTSDSSKLDQSNLFQITIDRKINRTGCTEGYILVNGVAIGYTLELPNIGNVQYISSKPKGKYAAKIRTDGSKGWRVELIGVPNRTNVQIHIGNFTRDILGCILIGEKIDVNNCTVKPSIIGKLQTEFDKFTKDLKLDINNPRDVQISVEITGV